MHSQITPMTYMESVENGKKSYPKLCNIDTQNSSGRFIVNVKGNIFMET